MLVIDESKSACLLLSKLLSQERNVKVEYATSIESALQLVDKYLPTVVVRSSYVTDVALLESVIALRQSPGTREVPIIVFCEAEEPGLEQDIYACGATELVRQSTEPSDLIDRIRYHSRGYVNALQKDLRRRPSSHVGGGRARVLMIDDSTIICKACEHMLRNEKDIVFNACLDPTVALETARLFSPTVILLDLEMPIMSGFDLLPQLRSDPMLQDVPVIMLSATGDAAVKARAFRLGANDYAEKQMDQHELVSRIQYHTRGYLNALHLNQSIHQLIETRRRLEIQSNFIRKTFGRYLSDEVVQNILETPEGLELGGEKREISIMMADLRGFTSLGERLAPEKVLAIINNFLKTMTEILFEHAGTIDEFLGDAILAMFGAPVEREDDARRAVACAVQMQLAMHRVNAWNRQRGYPDVAMGIGINTGEVVVGNIGSERRAKYGIVGRNVNLTARIESCTVGGQIMVSQSTVDACGPILRIDGQLEVMPKGVDRPITIFEVGGIAGEFNLSLPEKQPLELMLLPDPVPVRFVVLKDKRAEANTHEGAIVRLRDGSADIESKVEVGPLGDLKITVLNADAAAVSTELYAKVLEAAPGTLRVRFTSVPPEVEAYLSDTVSQATRQRH